MPPLLKIAIAVSLTLPAVVLRLLGVQLAPLAGIALFGSAVVASAFLLVWAWRFPELRRNGNVIHRRAGARESASCRRRRLRAHEVACVFGMQDQGRPVGDREHDHVFTRPRRDANRLAAGARRADPH